MESLKIGLCHFLAHKRQNWHNSPKRKNTQSFQFNINRAYRPAILSLKNRFVILALLALSEIFWSKSDFVHVEHSDLKVPKMPVKRQFWYFSSKLPPIQWVITKKSKSETLHPNKVLFTWNYPWPGSKLHSAR